MTILLSTIIRSSRYRKDYGDLTGLKASIQNVGLIHPIILARNANNPLANSIDEAYDETFSLVAGGRRLAALESLGVTELHHGSVLNPAKLGFLFESEVPADKRLEAELDENLYRLATRWQEDVLQIEDIHKMKLQIARASGEKWGQRQTAELLGSGYGASNVNLALKVAPYIRANNPEIMACENLSQTISVRTKWAEDKALAELQKRTMPMLKTVTGATLPPGDAGVSSFLDSLSIDTQAPAKLERPAAPSSNPLAAATSAPLSSSPLVTIPLSAMFYNADCMTFDWPQVSHIVTDIPYGIDMDNLDAASVVDVKDTHDVSQNISMMKRFLEKAFSAVQPGGFCVFFYDLDHHEKLQAWATEIGWRVQRWPFIAAKSSSSKNQAPQYNTTKNYECCMFLRRDANTVLRKPITSSFNIYDFAAERALYNNPFAKPFQLWKDIFDAIAFPGQSVLDPFAGECSSSRAAANCGLVPYGIEISEQHFNRGMHHMKAVYALVHKSNCEFI